MNTAPFGFAIVDKNNIRWDMVSLLETAEVVCGNNDYHHPSRSPHRIVELYTKEQLENYENPIRKPLTTGRIMDMAGQDSYWSDEVCFDWLSFARAIETAHGIGPVELGSYADTEVELSQPTVDKFATLIKSIAQSKGNV